MSKPWKAASRSATRANRETQGRITGKSQSATSTATPQLFDIFEGIRDGALELRAALLEPDWDRVGDILRDAHPLRKRLSPHITTPHMDELIETAVGHGAIAAKVCGAGGGGCIAFFCEDGKRHEVEAALAADNGVELLRWRVNTGGLTVEVS